MHSLLLTNQLTIINIKYQYMNYEIDNLKTNDSKTNDYKKIYFIRHGETEWNKMGKNQGVEADIPLNKTGIEQAEKTGLYLKTFRENNKSFDCVITSTLSRAVDTAFIIANSLNFDKSNIINIEQFVEVKKGKLSGLSKQDDLIVTINYLTDMNMNKIKDPIVKYKLQDPYVKYMFNADILSPLGDLETETYDEVISRVMYCIDYIKNIDSNKIIIVSHHGFLRTFLQTILNSNVFPQGNLDNGTNCWISYVILQNNSFKLISPPNTEHLSI